PAEQVKQQVLAVAQDVFDVVPKNPQEPHIAQHVHPAAVKKHGGKNGGEPEMIRDQAVIGDERVLRIRIERDLEQEYEDVDGNQQHSDDRSGAAGLGVA